MLGSLRKLLEGNLLKGAVIPGKGVGLGNMNSTGTALIPALG